MRLVKQVQLYFQEGTSDKVYEVDLCEAGEGEFIVNFRYGRRGAQLKDGTKTPFPETQEKAEQIFDRLVDSKKKKGYQEANSAAATPASVEPVQSGPPPLPVDDPRKNRVRVHLKAAASGSAPKTWSLSRILWRAGELKLDDSVESLLQLSGRGEMTDYSLAWALGRCKRPEASAKLWELRQSKAEKVARIASFALADCLSGADLENYLAEIRQQLPAPLQQALETNEAETVYRAITNLLQSEQPPHDYFTQLYLMSATNAAAREAVYESLKTLPFKAPWFRSIRHIFKAAEMRLDAEIYGVIAYRFEKTSGTFSNRWAWTWDPQLRKGVSVSDELGKPDSKFGYSSLTRNYMRRRVIMILRRAGEIAEPASFIPLATGVLMAYDDEFDKGSPSQERRYDYDWQARSYNTRTLHYDDYAPYLPFNYLLYGNSGRYEYIDGASRWQCKDSYQPGQPAPTGREEVFPEIWDQAPDALEHMLRNSRCERVHEFAVKVWRANPSFADLVTVEFIITLLSKPYEATQGLGLDLARAAYDPANPNKELIVALAACDMKEARDLAVGWVKDASQLLFSDPDFAVSLLMVVHADVHIAVRDFLQLQILTQPQLEALLPKIVAALMPLSPEEETSNQIAHQVRETLLIIAAGKLGDISFDVIGDLITHGVEQVQLLGGQILLQRSGPAEQTPDELLYALLRSESSAVRTVGMEIFGKLSESALLERADILASFCISKKADVRQAVRPIVERLANHSPDFGNEVVAKFYPILLRKEEYEGLHEDVYALLEGPLANYLGSIPPNSCFRMFESKYRHGQLLGLLILKRYGGLSGQPMRKVVNVASCESKEVREYVWAYFREKVAEIKSAKEEALRILDSDWDDTRDFAFEFFRDQFDDADWEPDALVSICDSTRPLVQAFGRQMITRFFQEADGKTYLTKLAQHPSPEMQSFASNYLARFASDDVERLKSLEWYFLAVLSQVNRGRVAKLRAQQLLVNEALKNRDAAEFVMAILERQSATIAIQDKATILKSMSAIAKQWPDIPTKLTIKTPPTKAVA